MNAEDLDLIKRSDAGREIAGTISRLRRQASIAIALRERAEKHSAVLVKGILDLLNGEYEHPGRNRPEGCSHGVPYYQECGACISTHLAGVLEAVGIKETP